MMAMSTESKGSGAWLSGRALTPAPPSRAPFARDGYQACLSRRPRHTDDLKQLADSIRSEGNIAYALPIDARDEDAMVGLVEHIENEIAPIKVAVFNIGANVNFPAGETTARIYRKIWELAAFSGFLMGREVAKRMDTRGRGTILFTGATANLRGGPGYAAFAGAKFALRALAQSMARELGPRNIHVAHIVIDGAIDSNFIRQNLPDVDAKRAQDAILSPDDIAANYVMLHNQPRTAWTHELDLRPWKETW